MNRTTQKLTSMRELGFSPTFYHSRSIQLFDRKKSVLKRKTEAINHRDGGSYLVVPSGEWSRTDSRGGVWKAPAGLETTFRKIIERELSARNFKLTGKRIKFYSWLASNKHGQQMVFGRSPIKPAEFIIMRLSQNTRSASI